MAWLISTDQMGSRVEFQSPPQRIISLVPSQTELLSDLGLDARVVGITKFCVHPSSWRKNKAVIGGTKKFDVERIRELRPDLVVGNKEENYEQGITSLRKICPVWMSDILNLKDAKAMIEGVGQLTQTEKRSQEILNKIETEFARIKPVKSRCLYLMWRDPWMGAANKTFIHAMLSELGLKNVLESRVRYPELSPDLIKELDPDLVLLSSEPFPFYLKHVTEIQAIVPRARIVCVDGQMFSWYGSRMALAPGYFNSLPV